MTIPRIASSFRLAVVLLLFIGTGLGAQPPSGPRSPSATLFAPAAPGAAADRALEARNAARSRPEPRRARAVTLNLGALRDLPPVQAPLHLNLFDDTVLTAIAETLETRGPASFTWHGRLVDGRTGQATVVSTDGAVAGTIFTEDGVFEVSYVGDGVHEVIELDPMPFPTDDPPHDMTPPALDGLAADGVVAASDSAAQIDVMVVWTPAARNAAGGLSGIQSLVDLAVANTKTAYANSGITTRLRLPPRTTPARLNNTALTVANFRQRSTPRAATRSRQSARASWPAAARFR
jgi:peptidyl-Asp metalloendopeptidase